MSKPILFSLIIAVLSAIAIVMFEPHAVIGVAVSVGRFVIAAIALTVFLRLMDSINGIKFREWYIGANQRDKAIYFGARVLGLSVLAAACLS